VFLRLRRVLPALGEEVDSGSEWRPHRTMQIIEVILSLNYEKGDFKYIFQLPEAV
jgi:hypothetical protein